MFYLISSFVCKKYIFIASTSVEEAAGSSHDSEVHASMSSQGNSIIMYIFTNTHLIIS